MIYYTHGWRKYWAMTLGIVNTVVDKKMVHPLYQTTNQIYGSKKPTVHEMPTTFHGSQRKFSDHILKRGMFRDNGFNTSLEQSRITGPNTVNTFHDRICFHHLYRTGGNDQAEINMI
ncbi:piercer of microtubule wall 1 protein isoform X2 [Pangasianodon hypophthalmus]|uniref:piercer of microtubule wall 1 protein isoform X2 n=1 Tax=Pangasianodon hypophthalmus TaxID=310915 RepID=UPI00147B1129|nr:piercer of microtubule wall 1 protein isoform X2 [Pangasianodon hypophthalmus]